MEISEVIETSRRSKFPALRNVPKKKLLDETAKVDKVLSNFKTYSITKTNELFYAGAVVVTNRLGVKIDNVAWRKEPMWNRRLQNKIKELRKDSSHVEASKDKDISNFGYWERLERRYSIRVKSLNVVIEELKLRITAIAAKFRRYQGQEDSYRQNRLFENNQREFYREMSPGPDLVQRFWLKNFSSLHERVNLKLKECLDSGLVPSWLTRGRTSLLQKDKKKDNVANNYRPITCLPLMWKLLTGLIADQIYAHLDQEKLLPEEQKRCRKGSRGTNDLLYIDRAVIKEVKSRNKNLAKAWIYYQKAYDMVLYSCIIEWLDLFGVAENIKSLLVNSMEKWKIMLCSGNSDLGEVEIK